MEIPPEIANSTIGPEMLEAIQRGKDFEALKTHAVYARILEWWTARADQYLHDMRQSKNINDDHVVSNLVRQWAVAEALLHDFETFVDETIASKNSVIASLQEIYDDRSEYHR